MELVERAREVARQPGERFALLAFEGQLRRKLGQPAASITAYEQALALAADERQRCAVWIGMAAAMRIVDRLEEALSALDQAELIATRNNMVIELAELHNLRGNLHFPQGLIEECHEEHQTALDYARQAGSLELEAAALSGLADANSLRARIGTAHNCFHRALVIARANGFTRIEVANRPMRGIMRYYQNDLEGALEDCLEGGEGAGRIGHHRAEMVARAAAGYVLTELGRNGEARVQCELALDLARTLGARRFEASSLRHLGRVLAASGDRSAALEALESSLAIAREAGLSFSGPWALGAIALVTADPKRRQAALDEGERLLDEGGPFHNYFWFYRDGMEVGLLTRDWALVARHAAALEAFTRMEPVPWTSFFIERGRALAARGRGENDAALQARLRRLLEAAKAAGLVLAIPALQAALDGPGADGGADAED
jgi:tetratricopeptide (TPR) repeat protein